MLLMMIPSGIPLLCILAGILVAFLFQVALWVPMSQPGNNLTFFRGKSGNTFMSSIFAFKII